MIDTGIDRDHSEFAGVIADDSIDIVTGNAATLGDVDGHGTAVAGVIAARRNKALSHGVAFAADLLVVRADAPGSCPGACAFEQADVASATDYAVAHGARVINYSLGGAGTLDGAPGDALERAVAAGRIVVLSAGNESDDDSIFPAIFAGPPRPAGARSRSARWTSTAISPISATAPAAPRGIFWSLPASTFWRRSWTVPPPWSAARRSRRPTSPAPWPCCSTRLPSSAPGRLWKSCSRRQLTSAPRHR